MSPYADTPSTQERRLKWKGAKPGKVSTDEFGARNIVAAVLERAFLDMKEPLGKHRNRKQARAVIWLVSTEGQRWFDYTQIDHLTALKGSNWTDYARHVLDLRSYPDAADESPRITPQEAKDLLRLIRLIESE